MTTAAFASVFVGREREQAELYAALEGVRAGREAFFLLTGEAGIGKTRLAEELAQQARQSGVDVLWGSCREEAGQPGYWPWVQVLRAHFGTRAGGAALDVGHGGLFIADLVPEIRPHLPASAAAAPSEHSRFYLFDAVARSLRGAAAAAPVLIVLDDLHAADMPSLLLLQFLARELRGVRILLLGTYREVEGALDPERSAALAQIGRSARHIPLRGLHEGDIAALIERSFGVRADAAVVAAVYRASEGNPFFVDEVVRILWAEGALAAGSPPATIQIPQSVRAVVRERLGPLAPACRQVLAAAAVRGRQFEIGLVEAVSELPREQVLLAVAQARTAGIVAEVPNLLGWYTFAHGLIRETLYADLDESERVRLHRGMGRAIEEMNRTDPDPHWAEVAYHYCRAAIGGEVEAAVGASLRAGRRAAALLAYEDAITHYQQALQAQALAPVADDARRCELLVALGEARVRAGDRDGARMVCAEAAQLAQRLGLPELAARAALSLGGPWVEIGSVDEQLVALLETALAGLGASDSVARVEVLSRLARELYWSDTPQRGVALSENAVAIAHRLGHTRALAAALTARVYALWRPDKLDERIAVETDLIRLAQTVGDKEMLLRGYLWRMTDRLEAGDIDGVDRDMAAYARLAEELRQPSYLWYVPRNRAMRALLAGDFAAAEALANEAFAIGATAHRGIAAQALGVLTLLLRWEKGEVEGLAETIKQLRAHYPVLAPWQCGLAFLYCEQGRVDEARREFETLAARGFDTLRCDANWLLAIALLALACADLEDVARAAALYDLLLPYRGRNVVMGRALVCFGCTSHYLGALAAMLRRWDEAAAHFEDALRMHEAVGARPWAARTQARYARMLLSRNREGDHQRALALFDAAVETAGALGMRRLEERAQARRTQASPLPPRSDATSPAKDRAEGLFRRDGEYWTIGLAGQVFRLKHGKGLQYVANLLRHPNHGFHVLELISVADTGGSAAAGAGEIAEAGIRVSRLDDAGEVLDAAARRAYRDRVRDLRAEIEEAMTFNDRARAARLREELEAVAEELAKAAGLGQRNRRAATAAERARVNVTKQIKTVIDRIAAQAPALASDLRRGITTGRVCSYSPDPRAPIDWQL
jgi:tetratricopeptide (TPR) repeat protein